MTRQQLQKLITAGVFSAALLSGIAYADDATAPVIASEDEARMFLTDG